MYKYATCLSILKLQFEYFIVWQINIRELEDPTDYQLV